MKKFLMTAVIAAAAFAAGAGEEYDLTKKSAWLPTKNLTQQGDKLIVNGKTMLESKQFFDLDTTKNYKIQLEAKNKGTKPSVIYLGFRLYGGKKGTSYIAHQHIANVAGTQTTIVRDVKKGDTVIYLDKNAGKWRKTPSSCIALNAKSDFSDLPNFRTISCPVKAVEKCEEGYKLTLRRPFTAAIAKGTSVRQHLAGGYMYAAGKKIIAPGKEVKMEGKVTRVLPGPGFSNTAWSKYVSKVRVIALVNWSNAGGTTVLDDFELEIDDKD